MSTSKARLNKLAVKLASDSRYKFQKNGVVKKRSSDGKYREVGTTRHGYNVISYGGTRVVTARAIIAKLLLDAGHSANSIEVTLNARSVYRKNGFSLDDKLTNLVPHNPGRSESKRLSRKQINRMVDLFCEGFSVAKIARRFRRKISRSHISRVIKRELGVEA